MIRDIAIKDHKLLKPVELEAYPEGLPLSAIRTCRHLFQLRDNEAGYHVDELKRTLQQSRRPLDPIVIWPTDKGNIALDGHHRLIAYTAAKWCDIIPVKYHNGDYRSALQVAIKGNIKDKLSMTSNDKQNAAWRLVNLVDEDEKYVFSKSQITEQTGVGNGQLGRMRGLRVALIGDGLDPSGFRTWDEARKMGPDSSVGGTWDETKQDAQINEWSGRLKKSFGRKPDDMPEVFAMALVRYLGHTSSRVASYLVSEGYGFDDEAEDAVLSTENDNPEEEKIDF